MKAKEVKKNKKFGSNEKSQSCSLILAGHKHENQKNTREKREQWWLQWI